MCVHVGVWGCARGVCGASTYHAGAQQLRQLLGQLWGRGIHVHVWCIYVVNIIHVYMYMYASYILGWHTLLTARRSALSTPLSTAFSTICAVGGTYMRKCAAWMWERMHAC